MLVALYLLVALTGALLRGRGAVVTEPAVGNRIATAYLPLLVVQGALLFYVCRVGRPRNVLGELMGARAFAPRSLVLDGCVAVALWLFVHAVELAWARSTASVAPAAVSAILPQTSAELLVWVLAAVTVGFCEEVVFRGYLQAQLGAATGSVILGIGLQAALFGVAHLEQGTGAALRITLDGLALGAVARWRNSLIPGIVAHVGIDLASGFMVGAG